ncbi:MAG TPA: glycosyltransferase [Chthonomonadaceae bacterium]|nr:glycosyltransferase [Chthonomonadaceae bacterium]
MGHESRKPAISVVVASYNHAPYVRACIESALNQTHAPCEVIVVDDGSADGSREIIESFGAAIRPVFQANRGTCGALNAGFALASGDWIAIHNSDDVWRPEKLARQAEIAASQPGIGLVHTGFVCIDAEGKPYAAPPPGANVPDYHGPPVAEMLPTMLRSMPVMISSAMISRQAWERCGPFDERFHGLGDWDLCLRISEEFPFGFVDEPLTLIRKHPTNSSTDASRIPSDWTQRDWPYLARETMPRAARHLFAKAQQGASDREEAAFALACLATIYSWGQEPDLARATYALAARLCPLRLKTYLRYAVTFLPRALRQRIR